MCSVCGYVFNQDYVKQHEELLPKQTKVHCPYCNSTNVNRISSTKKAMSVIGFGILSNKIGKQWHCNNCKSDFWIIINHSLPKFNIVYYFTNIQIRVG